jgi:hypothetical protein
MYQRFLKYAAKAALQEHACKGVFQVEINNYSNISSDTYLCTVHGSIFYYYDTVDQQIIDYVPLNIVKIRIDDDGSINLEILTDNIGQHAYCIKLFVVEEDVKQHWMKTLIKGGAKYKRVSGTSKTQAIGRENHGRTSIILDENYKNAMLLQGFCDSYQIEANAGGSILNTMEDEDVTNDSSNINNFIRYRDRYKTEDLDNLLFINDSVENVKLREFVQMGESPEFQSKVDLLYDEAFVQRYVLMDIVETCNKYFVAADTYLAGAKEFTKKMYGIPLLFSDGIDALVEHKHKKHLQSGMLTETLHREKKGILGLKGLSRTGSNLKNIKKKGGLFAIMHPDEITHGKTSVESNAKTREEFEKITNSINFLTSTLDNSFAHINAMIKQQKLLVKPLKDMTTSNYNDLIDVLELYGKKHEKHAKLRRQYQRKKGGDNVEVIAAAKELHGARVNLALTIGQYAQQKHVSYLQLLNRFALLNEQCIKSIYNSFGDNNVSNYIRRIFLLIEKANEGLEESVKSISAFSRESLLTKQDLAEEQSTWRKTTSGMVGYLNKRSKTWKNKWMRRWFHVEGKSFFYTKGENQFDRLQEFDLTLASVRAARNINRDFCFELVSSAPGGGMRIMVLQASNKVEYDAWMQGIMDAIMGALDHVTPAGNIDTSVNIENSMRHLKVRERQIETLSSAPGNLKCCECNTTKGVEWLSLNLGVVFCLDCAGIHRSLGVHVSQCRSFKLDVLDDSILSCFASLGNKKANSVWEGDCKISSFEKPKPDTPRVEKENWIKAKYVDKMFLPMQSNINLVDAAAADDMTSTLLCIARGDDLNEINQWGATALGAAAHLGNLNPMTLLLLNGCNVNTCSPDVKWTPLHAAAYGGIVDAVRILVAKGGDVDAKEKHGDSPLDIAYKYKHFDCVEVMGGLLHDNDTNGNEFAEDYGEEDEDDGDKIERQRSITVGVKAAKKSLPPKPIRKLPASQVEKIVYNRIPVPKPVRKSAIGEKVPQLRKPSVEKRRLPTQKNGWQAAAENSARRRSTRHTVSS